MERYVIEWPGPLWWWGGLALGLALAALVWAERHPWKKGFRAYLLFSRLALGLVLVVTIGRPLLHTYQNKTLKPLISIAFDDSKSVGRFTETLGAPVSVRLETIKQKLEKGGYAVAVYRASGDTSLQNNLCNAPRSDLQTLTYLAREPKGESQVVATLLVSDGLFNEGSNPTLVPPRIPTYTLAIGDTLRQPDSRIASFKVNKLVAAGANYVAVVEVQAQGIAPQKLSLSMEQDGLSIGSRLITLGGSTRRARAQFTLASGAVGTRSLRVKLQPTQGEAIITNNQATTLVEVARLSKRVLLAAGAPHPDIKAIASALQGLDQLEIVTFIAGITPFPAGRFDVLILHGLPNLGSPLPPALEGLIGRLPVWYILSEGTDLRQFSALNPILKVQGSGGQDEVSASFNAGFSRFILENQRTDIVARLPPLDVPFGAYTVAPNAQVLLNQTLGKVANGKPLWLFGTGSGPEASSVLAGEGIWQWRLKEGFDEGTPTLIDYFIQRTVMLLAAQAERKRFRFQPVSPVVEAGSSIAFESYLEDRTGQPITSKAVELSIKGAKGFSKKVGLVSTDGATGLEITQLPEGTYTYRALTRRAGEELYDEGRFSVQTSDLEDISGGADFAMLQNLAKATGGQYARLGQEDALLKTLLAKRPAATLHTEAKTDLLIKEWWWLAAICLLYLVEIGARKLAGGV